MSVRLLSAEDAFAPVLNSILDRCSAAAAGVLSPKIPPPVGPKQQLFGPLTTSSSSGKPQQVFAAGAAAAAAADVPHGSNANRSSSTRAGGGGSSGFDRLSTAQRCTCGVSDSDIIGSNGCACRDQDRLHGSSGHAGAGSSHCSSSCLSKGANRTSSSSGGGSKRPGTSTSSSKKTVLQVLYDNTTAAAAVVAEAIHSSTAVLSSTSTAGQQQGQAGSKQRAQPLRSVLHDMATAAGQQELLQEPQLLLVFGPVLTLAGYPPYHARVAEIHHMGRLAGVRRDHVDAAFASYCQVLQRHGA